MKSAGRLGGHTDTHDVITPDAGTVPIDTGFIVHNQRTYPLLCRLFSELNVVTRQTEMSMSIHCDGCGLEYAGAKGLGGVFAQPRSLTNVAFLRLLTQIRSVSPAGPSVLARGDDVISLGEFLEHGGYLRLLRVALRGADRLVCLVGRSRCGAAVPSPVSVHLFEEPRDVVVYRVADLAHGRRRIAHLCRPSGQAPERRRHLDAGHGGHHAG